jgi:hypothetical protein
LTISSVYQVFLGRRIKEEERDGTCDTIGGKRKNYGWNIEGEGRDDLET